MASTNLEVIISARDRFTGTANKVIGTLGRMDASAKRVGKGFVQLGGGLARIGAVGAAAAAGGLVAVTRASLDWESALAGVNKTMDLTPRELADMGANIRKLALEIPLGANELAGLVEQAGALGIAKQDVIEFARTTSLLGVTTNVAADQAATSLGVMSNLLGLTGDQYSRFASTLVDLGNKGASTEAQILAIAERAAGAGATIGLAADDILGFSAAVANLGIEPEAGGSSLQRFFLEAQKAIAGSGDELAAWAKTAGMSGKQFAKAFEEDAGGTLEAFIDGLARLDKNKRLQVLDDLGLDDIRISRMLLGLAEAEKKTNNLSNTLEISSSAWSSNTAAAEEADKRFGTVASKLGLLKNQVIEGALLIGEGFLPSLGRVADKLKTILGDEKTRNELRDFGRSIGEAIDGINWRDVIDGARTFVSLIKTAGEVISALPGEVKAVGAALIALGNTPVLGGAFKDIVGGLANIGVGAIGMAGAGLGGKAGALSKLFAQPVFVTNWPVGFGAGGIPGGGGAGGGKGVPIAGITIGTIAGAAIIAASAVISEAVQPGSTSKEGLQAFTGVNDKRNPNSWINRTGTMPVYDATVDRKMGNLIGNARTTPAALMSLRATAQQSLLSQRREEQAGGRTVANLASVRAATARAAAAISFGTGVTRAGLANVAGTVRSKKFGVNVTVNNSVKVDGRKVAQSTWRQVDSIARYGGGADIL